MCGATGSEIVVESRCEDEDILGPPYLLSFPETFSNTLKHLKSTPETASKRSASKSMGVRRYWLGPEQMEHCTSKEGDESVSEQKGGAFLYGITMPLVKRT